MIDYLTGGRLATVGLRRAQRPPRHDAWARTDRSRQRPLTRDDVVRAGLETLDEVGLEGLTTRRVAQRLGVKSPSLYWHVRDKDELLSLIADAICAEIEPPREDQPWTAQLDAMAKLLNTNPSLKVFIVGHTDNQGPFPHNLELSQQRAEAVMQALTGTYHVAPARLTAKGIASLSPVASNSEDAGRAQNRRVELVQQ